MLTFIKNARVLTMDDEDREYPIANILIRDSIIEAIGPDVALPVGSEQVKVIDAAGKLIMPGVTNAHFHSLMNLNKGLKGGPLSVAVLFMYAMAKDAPETALDPAIRERISYVVTALGNIEMLRRGVTNVVEDAYYFPITEAAVNGTMKAYTDSGLRATISLAQWSEPDYRQLAFAEELLPAETKAEMDGFAAQKPLSLIKDNYRKYIEKWHDTAGGRIHTSVSISAPERCTCEHILAASEIASEYGVMLDSHALEAKYQRVLSQQRWGKSAIAHMDDLGILNDRVHLNHTVWVDDRDIEILAGRGCSVSHNVHCNIFAGSGVMPFRKMYDAGIPIGIGVDEVDADGTCNPWGVAKTALFVQHTTDPDWMAWADASHFLHCLTRGGASGTGRKNEIGMLAPGYKADLIMIDLETIAFIPLRDLKAQLLQGDIGQSVVMTMIDGKVAMENGVVKNFDEQAVFGEVKEIASYAMPELPTLEKLFPVWREAQLRAEKSDVGFQRLLHD